MSANRVLFDEPGPRGRRRIRIWSVLVLVLVALLIGVALRQFDAHGQLAADRWRPFIQASYLRFLWHGLEGTLKATAMSAVLAFPLGALLALLRLSRTTVVRVLATLWIELFRSVPLLLLIYAFLLALPRYHVNLPIFWKLVVPIVLVGSASAAEVFRAGVLALDPGQAEAAAAIGLRYWQSMRLVVLPQAVRLVLPALVTQLVSLLKDSTLGYVVSYPELMRQGQSLTVYTHLLVQTYLIVAVIYVVINLLLSRLATWIDIRLARRRPGAAMGVSGFAALGAIPATAIGDVPD
jgi:glutamate transport system permease protein